MDLPEHHREEAKVAAEEAMNDLRDARKTQQFLAQAAADKGILLLQHARSALINEQGIEFLAEIFPPDRDEVIRLRLEAAQFRMYI